MGTWVCPQLLPSPGWGYIWDLLAGPALPCLRTPGGGKKTSQELALSCSPWSYGCFTLPSSLRSQRNLLSRLWSWATPGPHYGRQLKLRSWSSPEHPVYLSQAGGLRMW